MKNMYVFFIISSLISLMMAAAEHRNANPPKHCRQTQQEITLNGKKQAALTTECKEGDVWVVERITDGNGNPLDLQPDAATKRMVMTRPHTTFTAVQPIYVEKE